MLSEFINYSVIAEQISLAPRTVYTRGDDTTKKFVDGLANERTTLLCDDQTTYSTGRQAVVAEICDRPDFADGSPSSLILYAGNSDQSKALHKTLSGDPLTGKLFGQSSMTQIMSSWFW
jgi:hypothetical protein